MGYHAASSFIKSKERGSPYINMSLTITGLIILIISQFVPAEEVETVMEAIGIIISWYGRYRLGDISLFGSKK